MDRVTFNRRDFVKLSSAAFSGMIAGSLAGCGDGGGQGTPAPGAGSPSSEGASAAAMHVCRGLNECKGQGKGGNNACAGQGDCATATAHSCHFKNECKGQGGCGETFGQNECKGQGNCSVPLMSDTWEKARANFEKSLAAQGKSAGAAPPAP